MKSYKYNTFNLVNNFSKHFIYLNERFRKLQNIRKYNVYYFKAFDSLQNRRTSGRRISLVRIH